MEINRDVYLNRLIVRKHNGFIKVITGIRRSGKSYLLNTLFYNHLVTEHIAEDHIIKFAFDSAEDLIKIVENPLVLDNEKEERKVDPSKFINWLLTQEKWILAPFGILSLTNVYVRGKVIQIFMDLRMTMPWLIHLYKRFQKCRICISLVLYMMIVKNICMI